MKQPTLISILKTDFFSLISCIAPLAAIVLGILAVSSWLPGASDYLNRGNISFFRPESAPIFFILAVVVFIGGTLVVMQRVNKIKGAFATGHEAQGTITKFEPFKDRAYLHYEYTADSQKYTGRHFIHLTAKAKKLKPGQNVLIGYSKNNPQIGFVKELFDYAE